MCSKCVSISFQLTEGSTYLLHDEMQHTVHKTLPWSVLSCHFAQWLKWMPQLWWDANFAGPFWIMWHILEENKFLLSLLTKTTWFVTNERATTLMWLFVDRFWSAWLFARRLNVLSPPTLIWTLTVQAWFQAVQHTHKNGSIQFSPSLKVANDPKNNEQKKIHALIPSLQKTLKSGPWCGDTIYFNVIVFTWTHWHYILSLTFTYCTVPWTHGF